jgi:hypothetical protein
MFDPREGGSLMMLFFFSLITAFTEDGRQKVSECALVT